MDALLNAAEQKLLDDGVICPCYFGLVCDDCTSFGHTSDCCGDYGCQVQPEHFHDGDRVVIGGADS